MIHIHARGRLALAAALLAGCAAKYTYVPLGDVIIQPRSKGCEFTLVEKIPDRAYDALGVLAPRDIGSAKITHAEGTFRSKVAGQVCAAGGDGVVVERDAAGRYVRGTIIKFR